mgnify:FL=1
MAVPSVALTQLIPFTELAPGAVSAIRNQVINSVVALASKELNLTPEKLVVRDIRPFADLALYSGGTTALVSELWGYAATGTTAGYVAINAGTATMGDQRYAAIYGGRDRHNNAISGSATLAPAASNANAKQVVSLIKINVGGSDKVLWDISGIYSSMEHRSGFSPSAVIIPQNSSYVISYYRMGTFEAGVYAAPVTDEIAWLQLVGVVVEPRGKVISP